MTHDEMQVILEQERYRIADLMLGKAKELSDICNTEFTRGYVHAVSALAYFLNQAEVSSKACHLFAELLHSAEMNKLLRQ